MPAELPRIRPQLLSELRLDLGRQAEVLPFRIIGTYLVTQRLQLFAERLASARNCFTAQQSSQHAVFLRYVMADRQPRALFPANRDLVLHYQFANVFETHRSLVQLHAMMFCQSID